MFFHYRIILQVHAHLQYVSMCIYHMKFDMLKNAKLTGLMNTGWLSSDSCTFPSPVVLISSCPFVYVFSLLQSHCAFAIWFNGQVPSRICHAIKILQECEIDWPDELGIAGQ